jgi:DNA polymerase/3'-5' exonuclease PolX
MINTTAGVTSPLLAKLVGQLREIGSLESEPRKKMAYTKAIASLLEASDEFDSMVLQPSSQKVWKKLPGIGDSICLKIEEFLMFGMINKLRELRNR